MVPNLGCRGLSHLGDLMFGQKNSGKELIHEQAYCDEAASHQLSIATNFGIILP